MSARDERDELAAVVAELAHLRKDRDAFRDQRNGVFETNRKLLAEREEEQVARLRAENETRTVKREADALRARVAELEARSETLRALCDAADHVGIVSGGWFTVEAVRRATAGEPLLRPDGITRRIAPTQALREDEAANAAPVCPVCQKPGCCCSCFGKAPREDCTHQPESGGGR